MYHFKKCDGCDKDLPLGSTKYKVRIEITSEFDGFLPEEEEEDAESALCDLLDQLEQADAQELEDEVHMETELTLCKACRDRLVENIEDLSEGSGATTKTKHPANLH